LSDHTSSNGLTTFSECKSRSCLNGNGEVEFRPDSEIVAGFGDLDTFREADFGCCVSSLEIELRRMGYT